MSSARQGCPERTPSTLRFLSVGRLEVAERLLDRFHDEGQDTDTQNHPQRDDENRPQIVHKIAGLGPNLAEIKVQRHVLSPPFRL